MAETWVLNETVDVSVRKTYYANFTTSGDDIEKWKALNITIPEAIEYYSAESDGAYEVYGGPITAGWHNEAYRTLTFETAPSGDLLTWLQANGTKQLSLHDQAEQCITDAYTAIGNKSGTIPTQKNLQNLAGAINTISTGVDTSDGNIEPTTVLKGYKGYAKGVAVDGAIETYAGTVEDVGPASYQLTLDLMRGGTLYEGSSPSIAGTPDKVADIPFSYGNATVYTITKPYVRIDAYSMVVSESKTGDIEYVQSTDNSTTGYVRYYYITGDCTLSLDTCLTGDTLITLVDGSQKRIDQLTLTDKILAYNPDTMSLEADDITYTDANYDKTFTEYDVWTFSDGTIIKTVHRHRFYNVEKQAMVYMDEWNIGEHAVNQNGERIALVSHENVKEEVKHYTIFTKHQNYFANGLLSGNRHTAELHL